MTVETPRAAALTTTVGGLWVLQVLAGLEVIAPELALRPHLPSAEFRQQALDHPATPELFGQGVIGVDGTVDEPVLEWLAVLAYRDLAVLFTESGRADDAVPRRMLVGRLDRWWVALERCGDTVSIRPCGIADTKPAGTQLVSDWYQRLCGPCDPAPLRPVTMGLDGTASRPVPGQQLDHRQLRLLGLAADQRTNRVSAVALRSGFVDGIRTTPRVGGAVVTLIDTVEGRVLAESCDRQGGRWAILGPGSPSNVNRALNEMLWVEGR